MLSQRKTFGLAYLTIWVAAALAGRWVGDHHPEQVNAVARTVFGCNVYDLDKER